MILLFLLVEIVFSNTCFQSIPLEFYNEDNRFSFVQQPLTQELVMSYPGCGDGENRVTTWYKIINNRNIPLQLFIKASSNVAINHAKKSYVLHRTHMRVLTDCPTSASSMGCLFKSDSQYRTSNITFTVPPNGHVYLSTYEFLNNVEIQSHLFIQIKPILETASHCQKADEVIFPLTQIISVKTTDTIDGVERKGQWHRIAALLPGDRYVIDTCGKHTTKNTVLHFFESCNGGRIEEGYLRSCREGYGSIVIISPSRTFSPFYLFVETEGERYDIHFQKTTKKTSEEACASAFHIPYIPFTIYSIPFAQYPLFINPCGPTKQELSTAFFGVTVHPNHEITMMTCGSQVETFLTVTDFCGGKCLNVATKDCKDGKIYTYTPLSKEGHSIVVALSEQKKETFGRARLVFKEKEIGKKRDDEIHIGAQIRPKVRNTPVPTNEQIVFADEINKTNKVHFLSMTIVIIIGCAFLLSVAYILTRNQQPQGQYIPL